MIARQGLLIAHGAWLSALPSSLIAESDRQGNQQGLPISHQEVMKTLLAWHGSLQTWLNPCICMT